METVQYHHKPLNYGLHEQVMQVTLSDKAIENVRYVKQQMKRDILGLRGPQWDTSVFYPPGKFNQKSSDATLSNTMVLPAKDRSARWVATTHQPVTRLHAPQLERNLPASDAQTAWNNSIAFQRRDMLEAVVRCTEASLSATRAATRLLTTSGRYVTPEQRSAAVTERARAAKETGSLCDSYLKDKSWSWSSGQHNVKGKPRHGGRATAADLEAVRCLPDDVAPVPTPAKADQAPDTPPHEA